MGLSLLSVSTVLQSTVDKILWKKSHFNTSIVRRQFLMIFQQCRHPPLTNKDFLYDALLLFFTSFTRAEGILSKEIFMRRIQSSWVSTFVTVISLARACTTAVQVWNGYFPQGNFAQLSNKNIEVLSAGFQFPFRASYPIRISGRNSLLSCCFCYLNYGTCFARERLLFPRANSRKFCSFEID